MNNFLTPGSFGWASGIPTKGSSPILPISACIRRAEIVRDKGTNRQQYFRGEIDKYTWVDVGSSYVPSEISAAFLWAQLEHLELITSRRQAIFQRYREALSREDRDIILAGCLINYYAK